VAPVKNFAGQERGQWKILGTKNINSRGKIVPVGNSCHASNFFWPSGASGKLWVPTQRALKIFFWDFVSEMLVNSSNHFLV
jgi:hypothetical protein